MKNEVKTTKKGSFKLVISFLKKSKRFFVLSIIAMTFVTVFEMTVPQVISFTVDSVIGTEEYDVPAFIESLIIQAGGAEGIRNNLWMIAILTAVLALCAGLFKYCNTFFNVKGAETLSENMRDRLFRHIQSLPMSWHMKNQTGDIIQRCTSDVDTVRNFVADQLISIFRVVILVVFSLAFMFSMNVKLSIVACIFMPIVLAYSVFFRFKVEKLFKKCDENEGILSTIAQENLTGVRVVRAFGKEEYEKEKFEKQNNIFTSLWVKLSWLFSCFWSVGDVISGAQLMLIIVLGTVECVQGNMLVGEMIAFVSYNAILIWPIRSLGRVITEMSKAGVAIDRIKYIMDSKPEEDKPEAGEADMSKDIVFDNVTYTYDKVKVLDSISFTIPHGKVFGILGGTGSGKSTLMQLLDKLLILEPENGKITIGGTDINDIKSGYLRSNIGYVLQEPYLFSKTVAENISITKESAEMAEIKEAAAVACVDQSISSFTKGYDTVVGERGVTLSGGQKQRTAIARMLMQKTPIMIFDDSLSAVDSQTDLAIRSALHKHFGDATVILISHRVTSLMHADKILVLDGGKVSEEGTHDELMAGNGIYRKVYDLQMSEPEEVKI